MLKTVILLSLVSFSSFAQIQKPCSSPSEDLCLEPTTKGQVCRIAFPKECGKFINHKYSSEASRLTTTLPNFGTTQATSGRIIQTKDAGTNTPSNFKILGEGTPRSLGAVSKAISKFSQNNNLQIQDQTVLKELNIKDQWRQRPGVASCDEYAYENFGSFIFFIFAFEEGQYHPVEVTDYVMKHYDYFNDVAKRNPLAENYPALKNISIGELPISDADTKVVSPEIFGETSIRKAPSPYVTNFNIFSRYEAPNLWYPEKMTRLEMNLIPNGTQVLKFIPKLQSVKDLTTHISFTSQRSSYNELVIKKGYSLELLEDLQELQVRYEKLIWERDAAAIHYRETQGQNPEVRLQTIKDFERIDSEILPILQIADQMGCLQRDPRFNACGWAPRILFLSIKLASEKFYNHQDEVKNICLARTKVAPTTPFPSFAMIPTESYLALFNQKTGKNLTAIELSKEWERNIASFNQYMKIIDDFIKAEVADIQKISRYTPQGGKKTLGAIDTVHFGQEVSVKILGDFGGGLNISSGWFADNLTEKGCFDGHNKAEFELYMTAFSKRMSVARLTGRLDGVVNTNAKQDAKIVLNDIDLGTFSGMATNTFVQNDDSVTFIAPPPIIFPVVGVPVTVKVKGIGEFGYDYQASGRLNCTATDYSGGMSLVLAPKAAAITTVSASVDAGLVEVGIKGKLNVAKISHPVKSNLSIKKRSQGSNYGENRIADGHPALFTDLDIGYRSEILSGNVKVFIDYSLDSSSYKLFSWPGFVNDTSIVKDQKNYSIPLSKSSLEL